MNSCDFIPAEAGEAAKPRTMAPVIAPATRVLIAVSLFMMTSLIFKIWLSVIDRSK